MSTRVIGTAYAREAVAHIRGAIRQGWFTLDDVKASMLKIGAGVPLALNADDRIKRVVDDLAGKIPKQS